MVCRYGQLQFVNLLLKNGNCDVNSVDGKGKTTLKYVEEKMNKGRNYKIIYDILKENGAKLTDKQAMTLLGFFDTDKDGCVNFDEFLVGIRGQLNAKRQAIVEKAFLKFNKDDTNDYIDAKDLEYVGEANIKEWSKTIKKIQKKFKNPKFIITGHHNWESTKTLEHTLKLIKQHENKNNW